jgi:hypothetical protein
MELDKQPLELLVSQPVEFPLFVSSTRLTDAAGQIVPFDRDQMTPLPPIRTVLKDTGRKSGSPSVDVHLHAGLTEIGTLNLWCGEVDGPRRWRLVFDVRSATETDAQAHDAAAESEGFVDESTWEACRAVVLRTFAAAGSDPPDDVVKRITQAAGMPRGGWPTSLLRRIWEALIETEEGRRRSARHEARWLNLLGYALRPGYGLALDDWRVSETWRRVGGRLHHRSASCIGQSWILWRRIGGGLAAGQQRALAEPLLGTVRALHRRTAGGKASGDPTLASPESIEAWRLLGSLELLDRSTKTSLGSWIADLLPKRKLESIRPALIWSLGRIGTRVPLYGPLNTVVSVESATSWLDALLRLRGNEADVALAVMQLARRTADRYRDLSEKSRGEALGWLVDNGAPQHCLKLVRDGGRLDTELAGRILGDALPKGLRIARNS